MSNYSELYKERKEQAEQVLEAYLPDTDEYLATLREAMSYSVMVGGKRIRPVLINSVYRLLGGQGDIDKPFMAAMEYLHTYSLVHDDMPAIDNDQYRRGNLTTHAKYGEATGLLAGDGLLHWSNEVSLKAFDMADNSQYEGVVKALKIFAKKSGPYGMLGGQSVDVLFTGNNPDLDRIKYIYELKTCALIEASLMIPAALAGVDDKTISIFEEIGRCVGLAFQIKDDYLDMYGDESVIGKPVGSDEKNNKTTYVTYVGVEQALADIETLSDRACELLKTMDIVDYEEREFLIWIINMLINRNN